MGESPHPLLPEAEQVGTLSTPTRARLQVDQRGLRGCNLREKAFLRRGFLVVLQRGRPGPLCLILGLRELLFPGLPRASRLPRAEREDPLRSLAPHIRRHRRVAS